MLKKQEENPGINPRSFVVMDDWHVRQQMGQRQTRPQYFHERASLPHDVYAADAASVGDHASPSVEHLLLLFVEGDECVESEKLYDHYAGIFPDFKTFNNAMDECTADFRCPVIDNTNTSGKIEDTVFWYKAKPREDFRVGFWGFAEKLDTNYREKKPKKQNGTTIKCISKRKKKRHDFWA